ncbi:MAG: BamA/TamA family outer membrane protein [Pirellulaceae bacterium]|nr:BamA/TamA family outer membrane protein [Pirellulaceae bacterium]
MLAATLLVWTLAGCASPGNSPWGAAPCPTGRCAAVQKPAASGGEVVVRGQSPAAGQPYGGQPYSVPPYTGQPYTYAPQPTPGSDQYQRSPTPVSGGAPYVGQPALQPAGQPTYTYQPPAGFDSNQPPPSFPALPPPPADLLPAQPAAPATPFTPVFPWFQPPTNIAPTPEELAATPTPLDVFVEETRTGRFMFGVSVNSNAGLMGQITIDERNFDIARPPTSWEDFMNGTAWRGAGQGFRIEAQPGTRFQRYLVSFTEPYFLNTNVSFNASGFYFYRNYYDWNEDRVGGRLAWGYRLTPDLSVSTSLRLENVDVSDPRVVGVPQLDEVVGDNSLYGARFTLTRDTRDIPFMPTEGQLIEMSFEQTFGSFDYPRGDISLAQYFMLRERPDGSGRHTLALTSKVGFSGSDTPIFENYFAGGYSTIRGFQFRGASPLVGGVRVGGQFQWINSVEYFFPLTADDMVKATVFCDFGTVEEDIALRPENFRVAPGFGFRINVPAMGPAPLAFDFAFPVATAAGDDEQTFSFFFGATR